MWRGLSKVTQSPQGIPGLPPVLLQDVSRFGPSSGITGRVTFVRWTLAESLDDCGILVPISPLCSLSQDVSSLFSYAPDLPFGPSDHRPKPPKEWGEITLSPYQSITLLQ